MDRIRVLRVLEYEGTREAVELAIAQRSVKGERRISQMGSIQQEERYDYVIREAIIGEVPVILSYAKETGGGK